ncbi:hypothetical protein O181_103695 [Austropuccinia psidii MF-1]|uniref:Uncharacterized protein n=1 Tax=Austropuccinia psidii MF-1 TaxID=1389203 RepID=A0A9Q3JM34_9BASI|nr:hypothetical protein [Austropuccinia psidii MF-1]
MRGVQQWYNISSSWANTGGPIPRQGNPIGVATEVPNLVTRKDGSIGILKGALIVISDAERNDQLDGEEIELICPTLKKRIYSTLTLPSQATTTATRAIRSPGVRYVYEIVDNITINQKYYDCSYER